MSKNVACLILMLAMGSSLAFAAPGPDNPRSVALKFVSALVLDMDLEAAKAYVSPDAARRNDGPGSMVKAFAKSMKKPEAAQASIKRIIFFEKSEIEVLAKEYRFNADRVRARIDTGLGMLVILMPTGKDAEAAKAAGKEPQLGIITFVIQEVSGHPLVVYSDEN